MEDGGLADLLLLPPEEPAAGRAAAAPAAAAEAQQERRAPGNAPLDGPNEELRLAVGEDGEPWPEDAQGEAARGVTQQQPRAHLAAWHPARICSTAPLPRPLAFPTIAPLHSYPVRSCPPAHACRGGLPELCRPRQHQPLLALLPARRHQVPHEVGRCPPQLSEGGRLCRCAAPRPPCADSDVLHSIHWPVTFI